MVVDQIISYVANQLSDPVTSFAVGAVTGAAVVGWAVLKAFPKKWTNNKHGWSKR